MEAGFWTARRAKTTWRVSAGVQRQKEGAYLWEGAQEFLKEDAGGKGRAVAAIGEQELVKVACAVA